MISGAWNLRRLCRFIALTAAAAAVGSVSSTPASASAVHGELNGVSCSSPSSCLAVGTIAAAWNGRGWRSVPMPAIGGGIVTMNAVSCPAEDDCAAVGQVGTKTSTHAIAERWNGTAWTAMPLGSKTATDLQVVSCPTSSFCIAGGNTGAGRSPRAFSGVWAGPAGRVFTSKTTPSPSDAVYTQLRELSCASATVCVALATYQPKGGGVGIGALPTRAEAWNGTRWTPLPSRYALDGVSCLPGPSISSCLFLGVFGSLGAYRSDTLIDGPTGWTGAGNINASAKLSGSPYAYTCATQSSCQAVGQRGLTSGDVLTYAEHWNGNRWANVASSSPNSPAKGSGYDTFFAVSCPEANACQAVGRTNQSPLAERWTGTRWAAEHIP